MRAILQTFAFCCQFCCQRWSLRCDEVCEARSRANRGAALPEILPSPPFGTPYRLRPTEKRLETFIFVKFTYIQQLYSNPEHDR